MSALPRSPIRVLIADGDPLVGRALRHLLQDVVDLEVVALAVDGGTALESAGRLQPAVMVIDAGSARLDGLALTRRLREWQPAPRVVVVSVYGTFRDQALAAGACQFLLKDCSRDELSAAIRRAAQGQCAAHGNGRRDPATVAEQR
jgi:DNA-binding NarL/FixJ family response regulator